MAKSRRVTFELPPTSYALLEQAAQENGINVPAAASLVLQAALARRVSGLVPKRTQPAKSGSNGRFVSGSSKRKSCVWWRSPLLQLNRPDSSRAGRRSCYSLHITMMIRSQNSSLQISPLPITRVGGCSGIVT